METVKWTVQISRLEHRGTPHSWLIEIQYLKSADLQIPSLDSSVFLNKESFPLILNSKYVCKVYDF